MVPSGRLLFWFAMVVPPMALLGPMVPSFAQAAAIGVLCFVLIAVADAALSVGRTSDVSISFPEVIRMSNGKAGSLGMSVTTNARPYGGMRLGLVFPREIVPGDAEISIKVPDEGQTAHYEWACTPMKRGAYAFEGCHVEQPSRLGMWAIRRRVPVSFEVRVYPNLLDEKRAVAAMLLNRAMPGDHLIRQVGQGREFERLREYVQGDGYDSIHWKATARRSRPITKVYQIEQSQDIYVIIDSSRLSARPPGIKTDGEEPMAGHESALERFITAGLVLCMAAERRGDNFGLVTFSDGVGRFLRAGSGKAHFNACKEALYTLGHDSSTADYNELCSFLTMRLRKRAMLFFLTNLDDPVLAESFMDNMKIVSRKHLSVACMIKPAVAEPLFSGVGARTTDEVYARLGGHMVWHSLNELGRAFAARGVTFRMMGGGSMASELVELYTMLKRRQAL